MPRIVGVAAAIAFVALMLSTATQAQSRLAFSCQAECESNVNVCLKYLEACHQPGNGCDEKRAQCSDAQACIRTTCR
jgi:hypothetical protein